MRRPPSTSPGGLIEQRHLDHRLVDEVAVRGLAVVAEPLAVVRGVDDEAPLVETELIEGRSRRSISASA